MGRPHGSRPGRPPRARDCVLAGHARRHRRACRGPPGAVYRAALRRARAARLGGGSRHRCAGLPRTTREGRSARCCAAAGLPGRGRGASCDYWIFNGLEVVGVPGRDRRARVASRRRRDPRQRDGDGAARTRPRAPPRPNPTWRSSTPPRCGASAIAARASWWRAWTPASTSLTPTWRPAGAAAPAAGSCQNGEHPDTPTDISGHGTQTMGVMVPRGGGRRDRDRRRARRALDRREDLQRPREWPRRRASIPASSGCWTLTATRRPLTRRRSSTTPGPWPTPAAAWSSRPTCGACGRRALLPVFAAGNGGPATGASGSTANNPEAFAVGATEWRRRHLACEQRPRPLFVRPTGVPAAGRARRRRAHEQPLRAAIRAAERDIARGAACRPVRSPCCSERSRRRGGRAAGGGASRAGPSISGDPGADNVFGAGRLDVRAAYDWLATAPDFALHGDPGLGSPCPPAAAGGTGSRSPRAR